jgi:hypothetical protein
MSSQFCLSEWTFHRHFHPSASARVYKFIKTPMRSLFTLPMPLVARPSPIVIRKQAAQRRGMPLGADERHFNASPVIWNVPIHNFAMDICRHARVRSSGSVDHRKKLVQYYMSSEHNMKAKCPQSAVSLAVFLFYVKRASSYCDMNDF